MYACMYETKNMVVHYYKRYVYTYHMYECMYVCMYVIKLIVNIEHYNFSLFTFEFPHLSRNDGRLHCSIYTPIIVQ